MDNPILEMWDNLKFQAFVRIDPAQKIFVFDLVDYGINVGDIFYSEMVGSYQWSSKNVDGSISYYNLKYAAGSTIFRFGGYDSDGFGFRSVTENTIVKIENQDSGYNAINVDLDGDFGVNFYLIQYFADENDVFDFAKIAGPSGLNYSRMRFSAGGDDTVYLPQTSSDSFKFFGGSYHAFRAGLGNDTVVGRGVDDEVLGEEGADLLSGGDGDDVLNGGLDADTLSGDAGNDILEGGSANDKLDGGSGNDTLRGGDGADTISGGANIDRIYGALDADNMNGGDGDDRFIYLDGLELFGDTIHGGNGFDRIRVEGGGTYNFAHVSAQSVERLDVGTNAAVQLILSDNLGALIPIPVVGRIGTDPNVAAVSSGVYVDGSKLSDSRSLRFSGETTAIVGGFEGFEGADTVLGGGGADTIIGGLGADSIYGALGADSMLGGDGDDRFVYQDASEVVGDTINGGGDFDRIRIEGGGIYNFASVNITSVERVEVGTNAPVHIILSDNLSPVFPMLGAIFPILIAGQIGSAPNVAAVLSGVYVDGSKLSDGRSFMFLGRTTTTDDGVEGFRGADTVFGSAAADTITGGEGNDELFDIQGADNISGDGGRDSIWGGSGADTLDGGADDDILYAGPVNPFLPQFTPDDAANDLSGGAGDDTLHAWTNQPTLRDTLDGGTGTDIYFVDGDDIILTFEADEVVHLMAAGSADKVMAFASEAGTRITTFAIEGGGKTGQVTFGNRVDPRELAVVFVPGAPDGVSITYDVNVRMRLEEAIREMLREVARGFAVGSEVAEELLGSLAQGTGKLVINALPDRFKATVVDRVTKTLSGTGVLDGLDAAALEALKTEMLPKVGAVLGEFMTRIISEKAVQGSGMTTRQQVIEEPAIVEFASDIIKAFFPVAGAWLSAGELIIKTGFELAFQQMDREMEQRFKKLPDTGVWVRDATKAPPPPMEAASIESGDGKITQVVAASQMKPDLATNGTDFVVTNLANATLPTGVENGSLVADSRSTGVNLTGNALDNRLNGNAAANKLSGGEGRDTLSGGAGADTLIGGAGNDTYIVDNVLDRVRELRLGGIDTVLSSVSFTLTAELEDLILTGDAAINGTGNTLANRITGNSAANVLVGARGADTLIGGAGDDLYRVDSLDRVVELAGEGADTVSSTGSFSLDGMEHIEVLQLTGGAVANGIGNAGDNRLVGNIAANILTGGLGNDLLQGGAGDDTLRGGEGADTLIGSIGTDRLEGGAGNDVYVIADLDSIGEAADGGIDLVQASISFVLAGHVENLSLTGAAAIDGTGSSRANVLTGNANANKLEGLGGSDILSGGQGNDTLIGGQGADTLTGGLGSDTFRFLAVGDRRDIITDYAASDDTLEFSAAGFGGGLAAGMNLGATGKFISNLTGLADAALGQFVFETDTRKLWWDADGTGAGARFEIVRMQGLTSLAASEIVVIA